MRRTREGAAAPLTVEDDPDIAWLLCEAPGLLGERSSHAAVVAALESGTPGNGSPSSSMAEDRIERARPHIARARRLQSIWACMRPEARALLLVHYTPRNHWPPGVLPHLGRLSALCLHLAPRRASLEMACSNAILPQHAATIRRALDRARRALAAAHRAWRAAKADHVLTWMRG